MRIALAQISPVIGALDANLIRIKQAISQAQIEGAELVIFPEFALSGAPCGSLLFNQDFLGAVEEHLRELTAFVAEHSLACVIGAPMLPVTDTSDRTRLVRGGSAAYFIDRSLTLVAYKTMGEEEEVGDFNYNGRSFTLSFGPEETTRPNGSHHHIILATDPWYRGMKDTDKPVNQLKKLAKQLEREIIYCNQCGASDETVFAGGSSVVDRSGNLVFAAAKFEEELRCLELNAHGSGNRSETSSSPVRDTDAINELDELWSALSVGLRDYVDNNSFETVLVSSSGGIDSALLVALSCDALGSSRVRVVTLPSRYTSDATLKDALGQAKTLGLVPTEIPIDSLNECVLSGLDPMFSGTEVGVAEENIQARLRGLLVMALSNKFHWLPLTASNRTELAIGYTTLYGDMCGSLAPLGGIPKTLVIELAKRRNEIAAAGGEPLPIPPSVIERKPSAELRPDQYDSDSLPPYPLLDSVLSALIDEQKSVSEIIEMGYERELVKSIYSMYLRSAFKRRQAAPKIRVTPHDPASASFDAPLSVQLDWLR